MSYAVSKLASSASSDLEEAKPRARQLVAYLSSRMEQGLKFAHVGQGTQLQGYSDASFAPIGKYSHSGCLSAAYCVKTQEIHPLAWCSVKQGGIVARSSCETELLALNVTYDKELGESKVPVLWSDSTAALAILRTKTPSWWNRHVSIKGELARQHLHQERLVVAYLSGGWHVADVLTKGYTRQVAERLLPLFMTLLSRWKKPPMLKDR
eukprot:4238343-Amphidinium_carterae.1